MDLSLIVPCFNEADFLEKNIQIVNDCLKNTRWSYEIILVDDVSLDHTREVIQKIVKADPKIRYIFNAKNSGRGYSFKKGFRESSGTVAGFIDIDLEVGAHFMAPMIDLLLNENYDVVIGRRYYLYSQIRSYFRVFISSGYRILSRKVLGHEIRDSESGIKFFNRASAGEAVLSSQNDSWFWDTEVVYRCVQAKLRINEFPVLFLRNHNKKSTVRVLRDSWRYLKDLTAFRNKHQRLLQ